MTTSTHYYMWKMFVGFFKENKWIVIFNLLFLFLYPLNDIVLPHFYGKVMDNITNNQDFTSYLIVVVILLVLLQIMFMVADYHNSKLIPLMETYVRTYVMKHILSRYETEHEELEVGEIITKIIKIPSIIVIWFDRFKSYILPYLLVYLFAIVYFFVIDWQLAASLLITVMLLVLILVYSPRECANISMARDRSFNEIHKQIDDILNNLFSVYGGGQKEAEINRLQDLANVYAKYYEKTTSCAVNHMVYMNPVVLIFIMFFAWRCKIMVDSKEMASSTFISVFIIFIYILNSVVILNDQLRDIIFEWGMIDASTDILFSQANQWRRSPQPLNSPYPLIPSSGIGMHNVTFSYPGHRRLILQNFSLHIKPGERLCLVGDIGSGKSTIIKLLLRYHEPDAGVVYWNGTPYSDFKVETLRKHIGYVPQQPVLFNRSVIDNILYGNTTANRSYVETIMKYFGIFDEFNSLEKGLDTVIGKNGSKLSGGQRQLIWCLRVMLYDPQVLVLDEPTASVDQKTKEILQSMLNVIMRNKTIVMVTHDPFLVSNATRVVTLSGGLIISDQSK